MSSWSSRRKSFLGGGFLIVIFAIIFLIVFSFIYKKPTCFDNIMNGNEKGVDCGGSCVKLCQTSFLSPRITWGGAKFEKVANGLYNVASYVENLNINAGAKNVPYKISLFDEKGLIIIEKIGYMDIPAHRNVLVFEPAINTGKRVPIKSTFEFLQSPVWFKSDDKLGDIVVGDKKYNEDENSSSFEVSLMNKGLNSHKDIQVAVVLFNNEGNVIGFSKTNIDEISPKGGKESAFFTWPIKRDNKVVSEEIIIMNDDVSVR